MDSKDRDLISILRRNGRASISDLSVWLNLSRTTVRSRLKNLKEGGEILGYTVVLRDDVSFHTIRGTMMIELSDKNTEKVIPLLDRLPEVKTIHTTTGRWGIIIELGTDSLESLELIISRIRKIPGVSRSETSLYMSTKRTNSTPDRVKTLLV